MCVVPKREVPNIYPSPPLQIKKNKTTTNRNPHHTQQNKKEKKEKRERKHKEKATNHSAELREF